MFFQRQEQQKLLVVLKQQYQIGKPRKIFFLVARPLRPYPLPPRRAQFPHILGTFFRASTKSSFSEQPSIQKKYFYSVDNSFAEGCTNTKLIRYFQPMKIDLDSDSEKKGFRNLQPVLPIYWPKNKQNILYICTLFKMIFHTDFFFVIIIIPYYIAEINNLLDSSAYFVPLSGAEDLFNGYVVALTNL